MAADGKRTRRQLTDAFKADVVELCRSSGKTVGQVAREMDLTETAVRRWVVQAAVDRGEREGLTSARPLQHRRPPLRLKKCVRQNGLGPNSRLPKGAVWPSSAGEHPRGSPTAWK